VTHLNLGGVYFATGRYPEAETSYQHALAVSEKLGKDHLATALPLLSLANTYRQMGRYQEAESFARRSLAIRRSKLGADHPDVADSVNILGLVCDLQGRFKEAEKLVQEALEIRTRKLGKNSLAVAMSLNNMGLVCEHMDRLDDAEKYFRRALAIREAQLGPDHPAVASSLTNLAVLLVTLGRQDEAEMHFKRSLAIHEAKQGKDSPALVPTLVSLGALYRDQRRWEEAEVLCRRGLAIAETRLGKDHIQTVPALNNLAILYSQTNRQRDAQTLYLRALKIREVRLGSDHPDIAVGATNLGNLYVRTGDYQKAGALLERALKITEAAYGKDSSQVSGVLQSQTALHQAMGRTADAVKTQERCLEIHQLKLRNLFGYASESAMYDYLENNSGKVPNIISLAAQAPDDPAATGAALTWVLRLRGTVFDSLCRYRQAQMLLPRDAELEEKVTRYRSQKTFLANAAISPPVGLSPDKIKKQIADAQKEIEELEKDIRRTLAQKAPNVVAGREGVTVAQVQEQLPADSALIEFCHTPIRDFKKGTWSKHHYLAFVLTAGKDAPRLIDLGPAKDIDIGIEELRKEFLDFQEKLRECETAEEAVALEKAQEKLFAKKSAALYARLFAPLRKQLGKTTQLYLASEASLNRLPFEALVDADGKYLIESYRCAYLSTGRDLLRTPGKWAQGTVVFAGPDYKLEADERLVQAEKLLNKKETAIAMGKLPSREVRSVGWKNLPGAAAEARDIQTLLHKGAYGPVKAYVGKDALEEVLKAMPAPRVLHLATHGFFLDRETDAAEPEEEGAGAGFTRGRLKRMENPLLRSGIVLAGANTVGDKDATARVDDGWVTAEEIAILNLQGTELVVLSACQTGLGDIKTGEGVYGLRRAFLYAGAQTLVTSLFEVPDSETRELMKRFYTGVNAGQGKLRALHSAQRTFIDERRQMHGAAHPFFWASFVLVGNAD
jgi:CHAT domain-containing protein/Tfp pilus assembly protein PilF